MRDIKPVKRSSDGEIKCSCKTQCNSRLCSCRKNSVNCENCNCNPNICLNKNSDMVNFFDLFIKKTYADYFKLLNFLFQTQRTLFTDMDSFKEEPHVDVKKIK